MHTSISRHERFKADCDRYKEAINSTSDTQIKEAMSELLRKLIAEANRIDQFYSELSTGVGIITQVDESRSTLTSIRKELEKYYSSLNR